MKNISRERHSSEQLLPVVYRQLRRIANSRLAQEFANNTLTPTELVHETYLRLHRGSGNDQWDSKDHFLGAAVQTMRRILIDVARKKLTRRRAGAKVLFGTIDDVPSSMSDGKARRLLALDACFDKFAARYPEEAKLVQLRFFAGMTMSESAQLLGISRRTAHRRWAFARAQLLLLMDAARSSED